ncbi:40S ribosomal protein S27-like [Cricetulus griseus]|uniref:40S ribosomal protein S27-like n=1 Tax=Cricetulus griseus TaxID=10029 RepID=A0A9J7FUN7_CRIGR|nr:40S ribosomal protein S27-like [Cricetulus griseus]XP_027293539.1 40S ribosomal protein S27-like [Cricetulus griseus]
MTLVKDLLHPSPEEEKRKHTEKSLVQSPNSYFMDVKCPEFYKITMIFSHAQTVKSLVQSPNSYFMDVKCPGFYKITMVFSHAQTVVCQPTG